MTTYAVAETISSGGARRAAQPDLTVGAAAYRAAVRAGALVVDIRSRTQRERQGVLAGAVAVEARPVVDLLDPRSEAPLSAVAGAGEVILVSDDGLDAELFALELARRGVQGVRAVDGGYDTLRADHALGLLSGSEHLRRERSSITAH